MEKREIFKFLFTARSTDLWRFIVNNSTASIPQEWKTYLTTHNGIPLLKKNQKSPSPYNLIREGDIQWRKWRENFDDQNLLEEIEMKCESNMKSLGYLPIRTINNMDLIDQFPSIRTNCTTIPCEL